MATETAARVDGSALLAAAAAVLGRYTDRSDLLVGYLDDSGAALRTVRFELDDESTFESLVGRATEVLGAAPSPEERQPDLVVALGCDPPEESDGVWLVVHHADGGEPSFQLERAQGLGAMGARFSGHLRTLLAAAIADPTAAVSALPVLTEAERRQVLVDWNQTERPYPRECLPALFEAQARATPDAPAASFGGERLSYAELDSRANQLANHLVSLGVGPEVLVGICVERSLALLVGLLGILKAGGAYVPIDPAYPSARQHYMLESSQAPVVVTQSALRDRLPVGDATVVCLDADWPLIGAGAQSAPAVGLDPEQLAYVIYTSGSTGAPKGVQIPHRALVNFLWTMRDTPGLSSEDVLVAVTTLSFDIAGLELYLPLIVGAHLVIAPADAGGEPRALGALLERSGATVMQATPTTWRLLVDRGWRPAVPLKGLCGGEALPVALAGELVDLGVELWNMYGPTETTIWSSCSRVAAGGPVTIGRPIANTTFDVLDARMAPVPVGVAGELWIGGDGVARGYSGRDDLTAERFVADPNRPDGRIYRTGDLVRYRENGDVEYLGRIDHQVKVRGFRIELGEIETVLASHQAVRSAVVVARGSGADAELAAYVLAAGAPVGAHALRQFLTQKLPAYMVPATITALASFPLTPNGKVDRKALPEPTRERSEGHQLVAPRTALERRLAAIWERELGVSPIGVTDDFFDLGVSSIAAASLFASIEHAVGNELPLGAIFRAPTIEALAELLAHGEDDPRHTSLVPIQPKGSQPPIFCVHGGAGTILHLAPLARRLGEDQPFYGLQSRGLYGGVASPTTVEDMATHYLAEMREVHSGGAWRLAGYCFGALVAFEMAQRLRGEGEEVELLATLNGPSPSWIRTWGWYANQPSKRAQRPPQAPLTRAQRARRQLARVARALREPRRFRTAAAWYLRHAGGQRRARIALALGRPLPEEMRERYFLRLHAAAERTYEPTRYPGELLVFGGEDLYEDPELGWAGLADGGLLTYSVPGRHDNNRQAMMEPAVAFVAERIEAYLHGSAEAGRSEA